jgi:hypothetical protein
MATKPTFMVGARAKIKIDTKTIAFATEVSYNVEVQHIPIQVLGAYEVIAYEPVGYKVSGSLKVIRYTANANETKSPGTAVEGNSVFKMGDAAAGAPAAFNPGNLILSQTFNIDVYDRRDGTAANDGQKFVTIADARFERRSGGLNSKGLLEETYSFNGILMHDDAATVSPSGPNG